VNWPGSFFVTVKVFFLATQILLECVSRQPQIRKFGGLIAGLGKLHRLVANVARKYLKTVSNACRLVTIAPTHCVCSSVFKSVSRFGPYIVEQLARLAPASNRILCITRF